MELTQLMKAIFVCLKAMNGVADQMLAQDLKNTCKTHSAIAGGSAAAAGLLPGVGAVAAIGVSAVNIWHMYYSINEKLGLKFSQNIMKSLATGVATNLAASFISSAVMGTVFSLFPGIGSALSAGVMGVTCYGLTLASAVVYFRVLAKFAKSNVKADDIDLENLKSVAKEVMDDEDFKTVVDEAKQAAKSAKENGEFKKTE